ncbi:MAG: hypothetical protein KAH54_04270 [Candidatus Sabulitectum sp.]|nr:hypothetical protein [Candidatus Sabulitectum sp.]
MSSESSKISNKHIVRTFSPGWYASVMGTAVMVIAIFVFKEFVPFADQLQLFFLGLSALLFVAISVPWFLRWGCCLDAIREDFKHPVSAAFFSTMPISLIVWGIALEKAGPLFLPHTTIHEIMRILWLLGGIGIGAFAITFLATYFGKKDLEWQTANLGWLIPPVSVLILPVLGNSLAVIYAGTAWGSLLLFSNLIALGTGVVLYIFVASTVFSRYLFHKLPPSHLAPTMWIGITPTAIIAIIIIKMIPSLKIGLALSDPVASVLSTLTRVAGVSLWGFAFFWLLLAIVITALHHRWEKLTFAMSWWAFAFPLGAFVVSTGLLNSIFHEPFFLIVGLTCLTGLITVWILVAILTVKRTASGEIFKR